MTALADQIRFRLDVIDEAQPRGDSPSLVASSGGALLAVRAVRAVLDLHSGDGENDDTVRTIAWGLGLDVERPTTTAAALGITPASGTGETT